MLHATRISVKRDGHTLLDDLSVSLIGGELVGILGPCGAGKSTLLHALAGEAALAAGDIWLAGRPMAQWSLQELAMRRALLPQHTDVAFTLRVIDVVALGRAPHAPAGIDAEDLAIARQALDWTEGSHLAGRFYASLSGGEKQQVQLARVLAQTWARPPEGDCYIFLDAAGFGHDIKQQQRTLALARQLARDGAAVAVVPRDINDAAHYCDRLWLLRTGRLLAEGTPREVLTPTTIRRVFGLQTLVVDHPHDGRLWVSPQLT